MELIYIFDQLHWTKLTCLHVRNMNSQGIPLTKAIASRIIVVERLAQHHTNFKYRSQLHTPKSLIASLHGLALGTRITQLKVSAMF